MKKRLLLRVTRGELWSAGLSLLAIASFILSAATGIAKDARPIALGVLGLTILTLLGLIGFLLYRPSIYVRGYRPVMNLLEGLAETARFQLWTARTHTGPGNPEKKYFDIIESRLKSSKAPLEDFRRIIHLGPAAVDHMQWLVDHLAQCEGVRVFGYSGGGPQFDFMVVDGEVAVIGFPLPGGHGNVGAIVLRRKGLAQGVGAVFQALEADSELLFEGSESMSFDEKRAVIETAKNKVSGVRLES